MERTRVWLLLLLSAIAFSLSARAADWAPTTVPSTRPADGAEQSTPKWYRCYVRVPVDMTSTAKGDLRSQSVTLSLAGIHGPYVAYVNGKKIAEGDGLPDDPRKRFKVEEGILQKDKFNAFVLRLDPKAAKEGLTRAPILAGYWDEVVLEGKWEMRRDAEIDPAALQPVEKQPAVASHVETEFHPSSTPLAVNPEFMHGKSLSPTASLATFKVPNDLAVDLIASEPMVAQPTHISFDERGRMWVSQYRQYPYPAGLKMISRDKYYRARFNKVPPAPPHQDRGADVISVHEDADGDGVYEESKVVLGGLNMANAAVHGHGGFWVMNTPYLMFYPDADGDDIPDRDPEVRLAGFGFEDAHSVANGLAWGPDGWLYGTEGSGVTSRIVRPGIDPPDFTGVYSEGCMVWRYHPEKKIYEIFAVGGGNNFGLDFDSEGRLFCGTNGDITRGHYFVQSGEYRKGEGAGKYGPGANPYQFGVLPTMKSSNAVPRFSCGLTVFEGTALPAKYIGQIIGVNPLLHRLISTQRHFNGAAVDTSDTGFPVIASDESFRPVHITSGPDGAIYFADFYEEFIAHGQHYQSQIDPTTGRIYRLRGKNEPLNHDVNLAMKTTAQLIETLSNPNRWHRQTAVRLLGEKRDPSAIEPLKSLLKSTTATHPALEALWALYQLNALDEPLTLAAMNHPAAPVRAWAIRLAGDAKQLSPTVLAEVIKRVAVEPDAQVRAQVVSTSKRLPPAQGMPLVSAVLARDVDQSDQFIPLLCWWTIEAHCDDARDAILAIVSDPAAWQKQLVRKTILPRLMKRFASRATHSDLLVCAKLFRNAPSDEYRKELMVSFEDAFKGRSLPPLPEELASALAETGHASTALLVRLGEADAIRDAVKQIGEAKGTPEDRLTLIRLFGEVKTNDAIKPLLVIAKSDANVELQKGALTSLILYEDDAIGKQVAGFCPQLSADAKPSALNLLASRPAWANEMLALVKSGKIKPEEVPADIIVRLKTESDENTAKAATALFPAPPPSGPEAKRVELDRVRRIVDAAPGDPYKGEPIFLQRCAGCHTLFYKGGKVGPNLTSYQREDLGTMMHAILEPSAEIREGFETNLIRTKDRRTLSGYLVDSDAAVVVVRGTDGQDVRVPRDKIDRMKRTGTSLMPEGILSGLQDQQLRDFFAYLRISQPITQ